MKKLSRSLKVSRGQKFGKGQIRPKFYFDQGCFKIREKIFKSSKSIGEIGSA